MLLTDSREPQRAIGATSGSVPADPPAYGSGDTVTVAANSGNLQKTCHTFVGWNTKADGTGISYTAGSGTFHISDHTVLYAQWAEAHRGGTATCTEKAVCGDCGQSYGEFGAHNGGKIIGQPATCTENGWKDYYQCGNCQKFFSDEACTQEITDLNAWKTDEGKIAVIGHSYSTDWTSDTDNHWNICSDCGEKQNIAAHEFEWVIDKDATATESGSKHEECKICGYQKTAIEIPATGMFTQPADTTAPSETTPSDIQSPQTGDSNCVGIYIVMMLFALAGIAATIARGKKNSRIAK